MARQWFKPQTELNWTSQEDRDVRDILRTWEQARRVKAERDMVTTARTLGERRFFRSPDGFGGYIGMNVNAESFHYWGQRLGYKCWDDAQFVREYLRDNPYARVKNHARELTVLVRGNGGLASTGAKRFHKVWGQKTEDRRQETEFRSQNAEAEVVA